MLISSDSFVAIGCDHNVCQDYARAESVMPDDLHPRGFIAVSDGCSSSPFSELGAMLAVHAAFGHRRQAMHEHNLYFAAQPAVDALRELRMNASVDPLAATLQTAMVLPGGEILWLGLGDGVMVARMRDDHDRFLVIEVDHDRDGKSVPFYLSYLLDWNEREKYFSAFGSWVKRHEFMWHQPTNTVTDVKEMEIDLRQHVHNVLKFNHDNWDMIMLFTDGIKSFFHMVDGQRVPVPICTVLHDLVAVTNTNGAFLKRRRNVCQRIWAEFGWQHHDDLSMAALVVA
jgi:hypothetical protein